MTDVEVRRAKPRDRPYTMFDSGGLFLLVNPRGSKLWRMRYVRGGKEQLLSFGPYPEVSLVEARDARDAARALLRANKDPAQARRQPAATETFESLACAWHKLQSPTWTTIHACEVLSSRERFVFPRLGGRALDAISVPETLEVIRTIEDRPAPETARRVRQRMSAVFTHAIACGMTETDPATVIRKAMAPARHRMQKAVTTLEPARAVLPAVAGQPARPVAKLAMRLLALTAVRSSELRFATWSEFEELQGAKPLWCIPAERMKGRLVQGRREHLVPFAPQAVEVLEALRTLTGDRPFCFPQPRWNSREPMSENSLGQLLKRTEYAGKHVPHGWRATFSTVMNERYQADHKVIDQMLAHVTKDRTEAAYHRATHLERRRELAIAWADLLLDSAPPADELLGSARR